MRRGNNNNGSKLRLTGTRIVGSDAESDALVRNFMDTSSNPGQFYTRCGDVTDAFTTGAKKPRPKNDQEGKPTMDDYYSDEDNHEFSENDFMKEMHRIGVDPDEHGYGCNHDMRCNKDCRFYHDNHIPRRKHYYHIDGTTSYEKTRYGRFVREYDTNSISLIRLNDDDLRDGLDYPNDHLYNEGWHHTKTCPLTCKRYHYPGLPERYARLPGGVFHEASNGRWIHDWVNGEMAYIRIGPNNDPLEPGDLASTSASLMKEVSNAKMKKKDIKRNNIVAITSKPSLFRSMTKSELTNYLSKDVKGQDMAINELVTLLRLLQKPIDEEEEENMIRIFMSGATPGDKETILGSVKRLFCMQPSGLNSESCVTYSLKEDGEIESAKMVDMIRNAMLDIRDKERYLPEGTEEQSQVLLLCVTDISKETYHLLERLNRIIADEIIVPDDIYFVMFCVADFGAKTLDPRLHRTLESASDIVLADINNDMMDYIGIILPCFPTLVTNVVDTCCIDNSSFTVGGLTTDLVDREFFQKLTDYYATSLSTEKQLLGLVNQELVLAFKAFDKHYHLLFKKHPLFEEDIHGTMGISFMMSSKEESIEDLLSRYPFMVEPMRNPDYASSVSLCIENNIAIPYILLKHDQYLIHCIHIMMPVKQIEATAKRKREEIELVNEDDNNNKKKKVEIQHQWQDDHTLSNRKTTVSVCSCLLETGKHYQRPCSSVNCLGNGYKSGTSRGYCRLCTQQQQKK